MKKLIGTVVVLIALMNNVNAQSSTPETQASQIAQKMKDSLSLSNLQKSQVEAATVIVQNIKVNLRQLYNGRALDNYLFMAEDHRDSVYRNLLPADKYLLFKQKKATLLGNN